MKQREPADCEGKRQGPKPLQLSLISLSFLRFLVVSVLFYTPLSFSFHGGSDLYNVHLILKAQIITKVFQ